MRVLEIGSFEGYSALGFTALLGSQAKVTCLDPYREYPGNDLPGRLEAAYGRFKENTRHSKQIRHVRKASQDWTTNERFEIIYVDGSHLAVDVFKDAEKAHGWLKPGGILIFDDYGWQIDPVVERRPKAAIDRFMREYGRFYEVLAINYRVFLRKR